MSEAIPASEKLKFLNPLTSSTFKKVFKQEPILKDFLNHFVEFEGKNEKISELAVLSEEAFPEDIRDRDMVVDVVCRTNKSQYILIELRNDYQVDFNKAHVELALLMGNTKERLSTALKYAKGRLEKDLVSRAISNLRFQHKVISMVLSNSLFSYLEPEIVNTYTMRHTVDNSRPLGAVDGRIVLIMLANFEKTDPSQLKDDYERWLFALKDGNMQTGKEKIGTKEYTQDSLAMLTGENEALKDLCSTLRADKYTKQELQFYEFESGGLEMLKNAHDESFEFRLYCINKKVKLEGKIEERIAMVKRLLKLKYPISEIADLAEITESEVEEIAAGGNPFEISALFDGPNAARGDENGNKSGDE